jgi:hypothetical protein
MTQPRRKSLDYLMCSNPDPHADAPASWVEIKGGWEKHLNGHHLVVKRVREKWVITMDGMAHVARRPPVTADNARKVAHSWGVRAKPMHVSKRAKGMMILRGAWMADVKLTPDELAEMVGATRDSARQWMYEWRQEHG